MVHLFYSLPYRLPVLRALRKPVLQTVTGSITKNKKPKGLAALKRLDRIVVSTEREADILQEWGLSNYAVIHPGIETERFVPHFLPLSSDLTLLSASAPWVERQFALKGIDALIALAAQSSNLRIIFLWRGSLLEALQARIRRNGIADRVEIVNTNVDVRDYLRKAHATVLLAQSGDIVKSVPHSLLESLLTGKPVIISETIAMADIIRRHDVGVVVEAVEVRPLAAAVEKLRRRYDELAANLAVFPRERFSEASMIESYRIYYGL
jgi:glycosyltransferase involved in cell wall biosynthesis